LIGYGKAKHLTGELQRPVRRFRALGNFIAANRFQKFERFNLGNRAMAQRALDKFQQPFLLGCCGIGPPFATALVDIGAGHCRKRIVRIDLGRVPVPLALLGWIDPASQLAPRIIAQFARRPERDCRICTKRQLLFDAT
jgi:hypothetical protein